MLKRIVRYMFVLLIGVITSSAQDIRDIRVTLHTQNAAFSYVMNILIQQYDIPIGVEISPTTPATDARFATDVYYDRDLKREPATDEHSFVRRPIRYAFTLDFDDAKLSDVMDALVKKLGNYKWESDGRIINIFPAKAFRHPQIAELLALRLSEYDSPITFVHGLEGPLEQTKEITDFQKENAIRIDFGKSDFSDYRDVRLKEPLKFRNLTIKELLNAITLVKRGGWFVHIETKTTGEEYIVLNF